MTESIPDEKLKELVAESVKQAGLNKKLNREDIQRLATKTRQQIVSIELSQTTISSRSGPLPSPEEFEGYELVQPGAADRIIQLTEKEQSHRHGIEEKQQSQDFTFSMLGLVFGWLSFIALVGGAMYGGYIGSKWLTISCLSLAAFGAISQFVRAAIKKKEAS